MRLKLKVFLLAVIPFVGALVLIALAVGHQTMDLARRERALVEASTLAAKEAELSHYIALAQSTVQPLYDSRRDDDATKAEAVRLLSKLDYGTDGYFFLYDVAGRVIMHPRQPELEGKDLWNLRDVNGFPVIQKLIAKGHEGGGTVRYMWEKPSTREITPKMSYVITLPRWNWMLGTGVYLDDVQATMDQLDRQVNANIAATMWWIAAIAVLGVVLIGAGGLALNVSEQRIADAKLRLLARQVVQSQEDERAHLSRELHDSTSQTLVSIKLLMESAIARMGEAAPPALHKALDRLKAALGEVRNISHRLRPAELDVLGLPAALQHLGEEFGESSGIASSVRIRGDVSHLPEEVKTVLFRVTQEALTNIEKHAAATSISVWLAFGKSGVRLRVMDDGQGFKVDAVQLDPKRGIGLRNMRERLVSIGGSFSIQSRPGMTQLVAEVPAASLRQFALKEAA
ncbi:cache domain-containing protein [Piscinibacter terrae]|uniref:histidine kinase n=1 Tax=Piscinibacter terrae TaxID=2496871 RepID=A0A3N7HSK8_9BURK|nr:cache domain-containing protein [Albitalea terrae]RQP24743.1 histidine kinase [Albitalea terrae]